MALVVDTGVLLAALDAKDGDHEACRRLLEETGEPLVIPGPVLVELEYWLSKLTTPDVWLGFCSSIRSGSYELFDLGAELTYAAAQLQVRYADLRLGFVDASVVIVCDEIDETRVATIDRRHFNVVRTASGKPFEIVPG